MTKYIGLALLALLTGLAVWLFEGDFDPEVVDARFSNNASQFMLTADGARVHYRDQGKANAPALVLLHGSNASLHTWEPWIALLGQSYRVVTLDLPGHGLTGAVPDNAYDSPAQLATLAALMAHLELSHFVLGGNSMGGGAAWRYALQHPEQVDALILVDASGLWRWREERQAEAVAGSSDSATAQTSNSKGPLAFRLLREPWFRHVAAYLDTKALTRQGLRSAFHDPEKVTDEMVDLYYQLSMRKGTRRATLARFASFGSGGIDHEPTDADLATLGMPTLVLWGATDALSPPETGERFAAVLPDAKLIVYPNVGHLPMEEIPERSAADVLDFLATKLR